MNRMLLSISVVRLYGERAQLRVAAGDLHSNAGELSLEVHPFRWKRPSRTVWRGPCLTACLRGAFALREDKASAGPFTVTWGREER